jgi:hypothetical protein
MYQMFVLIEVKCNLCKAAPSIEQEPLYNNSINSYYKKGKIGISKESPKRQN